MRLATRHTLCRLRRRPAVRRSSVRESRTSGLAPEAVSVPHADDPLAFFADQFPPSALAREDGLLCQGGDLHPLRLLAAYSLGIFPWYGEDMPLLWWTPAPRCILPLENFRLPRRSARILRQRPFRLTCDAAFHDVMRQCAAPRRRQKETWITGDMYRAYVRLHEMGYAHSIEAWHNGELAGGLYGVSLGGAFFGESMFHRVSEASRAALAGLVDLLRLRGVSLLDCQQESPHIMGMGGCLVSREAFETRLRTALETAEDPGHPLHWAPWTTAYVHDGRHWQETAHE